MARQRLMQWSAGVLVLGLTVGAVTTHVLQQSASAGGQQAAALTDTHTWGCSAQPPAKAPAGDERRPLGTWERNVGPVHLTLTFTPERLEGLIILKLKKEEGGKLTIDFRADYSVTRDSVLYGIVSSAGINAKVKGDAEDLLEEQSALESALVDQPFSLRFRVDEDILMVKDLRIRMKSDKEGDGLKDIEAQIVALGPGRYTRKAGAKSMAAQRP